jgi:hypothetical protein
MLDITLKQVLDEQFQHVKINDKLFKAIYQFQTGYISQNPEHMEFFGSNLLGVHVVRFKDRDLVRFFDQVLDLDYLEVQKALKTVTTINQTYKISSDPLNITLMYLIYRINTDDGDEKKRARACYDTALIFFYRCVAALLSDYFHYPADPKIAMAAYRNLSNKHLIKKLGTWHRVMEYRAQELMKPEGIHADRFKKFEDEEIVYAINDAQGRIRDHIKNYYEEFARVHSDGQSIASTSATWLDADGEETIKEKTRSVENYVGYIRNVITDPNSFIKDELVGVIVKINQNTSFRMVRHTLAWLSENYSRSKHHKAIDEFISLTIIQSMYLIENNIDPKHSRDYPHILTTLKNLYLSTRTSDVEVEKIRGLGYNLIKEANGKISESLILSTRTSLILYLTIRALVGQSTR